MYHLKRTPAWSWWLVEIQSKTEKLFSQAVANINSELVKIKNQSEVWILQSYEKTMLK